MIILVSMLLLAVTGFVFSTMIAPMAMIVLFIAGVRFYCYYEDLLNLGTISNKSKGEWKLLSELNNLPIFFETKGDYADVMVKRRNYKAFKTIINNLKY